MLYPLLKIPLHYSASDRARKVRNKNLKIKKRKQWGLAKRKRSKLPQKRGFKKRKTSKKKSSKKESLKKESFKERLQKKSLKKGVSQKLSKRTHNSNTRYKAFCI
ncbi:hypothetical protein HpBT123_13090 [Helicobacter pylori]